MSLCAACVQVARELSKLIAAGCDQDFSEKPIRHSRPFRELRYNENNSCPLCWLLQSNYVREDDHLPLDDTFVAELLPGWVTDELAEPLQSAPGSRQLRMLYVTVRRTRQDTGKLEAQLAQKHRPPAPLQVFAPIECEEPLKTNVWRRYRFHYTGCQEALLLCQMWFRTCLTGHAACGHGSLLSAESRPSSHPLPTRAIDCGLVDETGAVRLVESKGASGSWVALSHCWGKPDKRPLATTSANIAQHMKGIELTALPRTFRDAIAVTRALGIQYLWIDSLCIIQGDVEDWRGESANMGNVYQYAAVTIAAAYAKDSSEGCFSEDACLDYARWPVEKVSDEMAEICVRENLVEVTRAVTLPAFDENENIVGSYSVAPWEKKPPSDERVLDHAPLFKRAWVMQEWALSRRTLIFLKDTMVWSCRQLSIDERGHTLTDKVKRPSIAEWEQLITTYTGMELTYASDRLAAIQGLANILQADRSDDAYFAGMWLGDLPDSLLWKINRNHVGTRTDYNQHLPSWTWARLEGRVGFQLSGSAFRGRYSEGVKLKDREYLHDDLLEFEIQPSGSLYVDGPMTHLASGTLSFIARGESFGYKYKSCFKQNFKGYSNCRQAGGSLYANQLVTIPSDDASSGDRLMHSELGGWAILDLDEIPEIGSVYCLAIKRERDAIERRGMANGKHCWFVDHACHVLLLQSVPSYGTRLRFSRIGMGVVGASVRHWSLCKAEIV